MHKHEVEQSDQAGPERNIDMMRHEIYIQRQK